MSKYNAIVDNVATETLSNPPGGIRARLELIGAAAQTPPAFPYDGVRLEVVRKSAGQLAPAVTNNEPIQVINATVLDVHNEAADNSVVSLTIEGCVPTLNVYPGDSLEVNLERVSPSLGAPPAGPQPVMQNA